MNSTKVVVAFLNREKTGGEEEELEDAEEKLEITDGDRDPKGDTKKNSPASPSRKQAQSLFSTGAGADEGEDDNAEEDPTKGSASDKSNPSSL